MQSQSTSEIKAIQELKEVKLTEIGRHWDVISSGRSRRGCEAAASKIGQNLAELAPFLTILACTPPN